MSAEQYVSAREAARRIGRYERTVRRWIERDAATDDPRLPGAFKDPHTGEYRVPVSALEAYAPGDGAQAASNGTNTGAESVPAWMERAIRAEDRLELLVTLVGRLGHEDDDSALVGALRAVVAHWAS